MTIHFILEKLWESRFEADLDGFVGPSADQSVGCTDVPVSPINPEARCQTQPPFTMAASPVDAPNPATGAARALELVANVGPAFDPFGNAIVARTVGDAIPPSGAFVAAGWFRPASNEIENLGVNLILVMRDPGSASPDFWEYASFFILGLNSHNEATYRRVKLRVRDEASADPDGAWTEEELVRIPTAELDRWHFFELETNYDGADPLNPVITRVRIDDSGNLIDAPRKMPRVRKSPWTAAVFEVYLETANRYRCFCTNPGGLSGTRGVTRWSSPAAYSIRSSVEFGEVAQCGVNKRVVRIANTGPGPTHVTGLVLEGADAGWFALGEVPMLPHALAPGEVMAIGVIARPRAQRMFEAELAVANTDADRPRVSIPLRGTCKGIAAGCYAPVWTPARPPGCLGALACLLLAIVYGAAIAVLIIPAIFSRAARCEIRRLRFRIAHCRDGNTDPCRPA